MITPKVQRFLQDRRLPIMWVLVFTIPPLFFAWLSVHFGKDNNWDLLNYHYYNAYAFVTNRMDLDIAPAQIQTYYNPLLDLPFYYMSRHLPAWQVGWILGFVHGFNFSFVFLIVWLLLNVERKVARFWLALGPSAIAVIAPGFLSVLGSTMNDDIVSLFVLAGLALVLAACKLAARRPAPAVLWLLAAGGFVLGTMFGMKLTTASYGLGAALPLAALGSAWGDKLKRTLAFGVGGLAGALSTGGFWWLTLYIRFGNPFFPYFNNLFRSPFVEAQSWRDPHFAPQQLWEYFVWPVLFSLNAYKVNQIRFSDIRFGLLYMMAVVAIVWSAVRFVRRQKGSSSLRSSRLFNGRGADHLLVFFAISFVFWLLAFRQYRYLIPLELLLPLCFLIILDRLIASKRLVIAIASLCALATLAAFRPFDWGRLPWGDPYISVNTNNLQLRPDGLVVMLGKAPTAYVIPFFPASYRFVHLESNVIRVAETSGFSQQIEAEIQGHPGAVYVLYDDADPAFNIRDSAARAGLEDLRKCHLLETTTRDHLMFCLATVVR